MVLDRKIAFIDLEKESTTLEEVPIELRKKFLGGRGINMALLARSFHCDLCGGSPQCVKVCTVKAISISRSA
jgi:aldehyde:ferredoxin oxidoreductase